MVQASHMLLTGSQTRLLRCTRMTPLWAVIVGLITLIYCNVIADLIREWWKTPDFSHGFLVPLFAAYLVWAKRARLMQISVVPATTGIGVIAVALFLLLLGVYGAEQFFARISLIVLMAGLVLGFAGWQALTELRFALLVLLLAIPIPAIVFNEATLPLQMLATRVGATVLSLFGIPVLRDGNVMVLPQVTLEIAEACSGIRSLMTLVTFSIFYGYLFDTSPLRRLLLAIGSLPVAIACNVIRLVSTGLSVAYWDPEKAMGFFHEFSGWVMYIVCLAMLVILHRFTRLVFNERVNA